MIAEGSTKLSSVPSGGAGGAGSAGPAAGGASAAASGEAAPAEEEKEEPAEESDEDVYPPSFSLFKLACMLTFVFVRWVLDCSIRYRSFCVQRIIP